MSFDLNVVVKNAPLNLEQWSTELRKHLKKFSFDDTVDWKTHQGFLPVHWEEEGELIESGFEFYFENKPQGFFEKLLNKTETVYYFSLSSAPEEFKAGCLAAATLAKVTGGILVNPQELLQAYQGDLAIEYALKSIKEEEGKDTPANNPYNTFDFKAHSALQKTNEKELHKIAKEILGPYQIKREGKSKTWLDDRGWYSIIIEILPSKHFWSAIVNIGVNFNWDSKEYMSYDFFPMYNSPRFDTAEEYVDNNRKLIQDTLARLLQMREIMSDLPSLKEELWKPGHSHEPHRSFHTAYICGLAGDFEEMRNNINLVLSYEDRGLDWEIRIKKEATELLVNSGSADAFKKYLQDRVKTSRALKKLPDIDIVL